MLASVLQLWWKVLRLQSLGILYLAVGKISILDLTHVTAETKEHLKTKFGDHCVLLLRIHCEPWFLAEFLECAAGGRRAERTADGRGERDLIA